MTDELEKKLLEEIKQLGGHFDDALHARLIQHRQTKKWIEGLIDNFEYTGGDCGVVLRELKKQISGEKK